MKPFTTLRKVPLSALALGFSMFHLALVSTTDARSETLPQMGEEQTADVSAEPGGDDMEKIAKMTANPIGAAWMLWTQNDYSRKRTILVTG